MMSTRKRAAGFILEKPLASRLPFEVEQPPSIAAPYKRPKLLGGEVDEVQITCTLSGDTSEAQSCGTVGLRETCRREEIGAVGMDFAAKQQGCWLGTGGGDGGRTDKTLRRKGEHADRSENTFDELSAITTAPEQVPAPAPATAPARGAGPKRALVQLKIDAMFAAPRPAPKPCSERCGVLPGAGYLEGAQWRAGPLTEANGGMDVDATGGGDVGLGVQADEAEGQAACYACRSGLGTEGGDILCSFCDRAACQGCWQKCFACEIPHCSLCLVADYSSQYECYFCPPCFQDRRLELR